MTTTLAVGGVPRLAKPVTSIGVKAQAAATTLTNAFQNYVIAFSSADLWDTHGFHDPAAQNTRVTIPAGQGGRYLILGRNTFNVGGSTVDCLTRIVKNGGPELDAKRLTSANDPDMTAIAEEDLVPGDYIELTALCGTAGKATSQSFLTLIKQA